MNVSPNSRLFLSVPGHWVPLTIFVVFAVVVWLSPASDARKGPGGVDSSKSSTETKIQKGYGRIPLAFEENRGQTDQRVTFIARGSAYSLFLTGKEAVFTLRSKGSKQTDPPSVLRMSLVGARQSERIEGLDAFAGKANYFIGNDPRKWLVDVPTFAKVRYSNVYRGIDLVYHGNQQQLEYDFVVAPGKSVAQILVTFKGAEKLSIATDGSLILKLHNGELQQSKPIAYQLVDGQRHVVDAQYRLNNGSVGFKIGSYDKSLPLVIDLVLMQYFGYLRRSPNDPPDGNFDGWQFWLNKLIQFNGNFVNAEMVKAFISSSEYLHRFGK